MKTFDASITGPFRNRVRSGSREPAIPLEVNDRGPHTALEQRICPLNSQSAWATSLCVPGGQKTLPNPAQPRTEELRANTLV